MFNNYLFNAVRFEPTSVTAQTFRDSISVVKVTDGQGAGSVLAQRNAAIGIGGRVLIGPTAKLVGALSAGATSIVVDSVAFANGDVVVLQTAPTGTQQTEFMAITSGATGTGPFTYSVTRNLDGSGADSWAYGDVVVGLGQSGQSFIDIYTARGLKSSAEVGPAIVANVRNSGTWNDWTSRWAIGNLNGLYGYAVDTFGAAFGVPTGAWLKIDPTNGVRIGFNATTKVQIDASGNASFEGSITAGSGVIAGWTIGTGHLSSGGISIDSSVPSITAGTVTLSGSGINIPDGIVLDGSCGYLLGGIGGTFSRFGQIVVGLVGGATLTFGVGGAGNFIEGSAPIRASAFTTSLSGVGTPGYFDASTGFKVGGTTVLGGRGAAVAHATDAASAITQLNALIDRFSAAAGGHGSIG